jgi:hypothetical protein
MVPFERALSMRLVIVRTIVIIIPFFTSLLFKALTLVTPVFNPTTCISAADDIAKILVIRSRLWSCSSGGVRLLAESPRGLYQWSCSWPRASPSRSRTESTTIAASNIAWRCLPCALTSSLSFGWLGVSWSMSILEAKVSASGCRPAPPGTRSGWSHHGSSMTSLRISLGQ